MAREQRDKSQRGYASPAQAEKINYPAPSKKEVLEKGYLPPASTEKPEAPPSRPPLKK